MTLLIVSIIGVACSIWLVAYTVSNGQNFMSVIWSLNSALQIYLMVLNILRLQG